MTGRLISGARELALPELADRAARAAAGFTSLGIGRDDSIALMMRNDFAFFEATGGIGQLGGYPVPVNWHYTADEANYILTNCGAKALIIHADLLPQVKGGIPDGLPVFVVPTPPEIARAYAIDPAICSVPKGASAWSDWLTRFAPRTPSAIEPPGAIIYTSGTTGRPKGVRRAPPSAAQALSSTRTIASAFGLADAILKGDTTPIVTIIPGPLYHSAPNAYGGMAVRANATTILQPRFDPEEMLALIQKHRVTHIQMVPTMFVRLLKLPEDVRRKYDVSSLRYIVHAAAPCAPHVKRAMIEWWGPIINEYYGATETGAVVFCTSADWLAHPGTVGKALPDCVIKIVREDGSEASVGEAGDVYCRLTTGTDFTYHGDDAKRRAAEKGGLLSVGDIGYLDADGFLFLCDRRNQMVISGGVNIYPAEIESELLKIPGVADCAVFGIPDDDFGESLCAVIQPGPGARLDAVGVKTELARHLAKYKVPKVVEFAQELPREDSGKIFKRKLRDPYWEKTGRKI